jgi:GTP cyclohydrolase I
MSKVDFARLETLGRELLLAIGENPDEDRIKDTPRRWAKWWRDFIDHDPGTVDTAFQSVVADQMVIVSGMRIWSLCEHHLLPFWCNIAIAYIPKDKVLGLSKFGRIARSAGSRLQIQERLVQDIALEVHRLTGSEDVAVLAQGEHLCMTMRGVRMEAKMTSSVMEGAFRKPEVRAEFLSLVK